MFIDEIFFKRPKKNYPTKKMLYNHIDEIWSIDSADMIDLKVSNNKGFIYIFIIFDIFGNYTELYHLKKSFQTITNDTQVF